MVFRLQNCWKFFVLCLSVAIGLLLVSASTTYAQTSGVRREDVGPEVAGAGYIQIAQEDLYRYLIEPQQYTGVVQIANALGGPAYNPIPQPANRKIVIRVVDFGPNTPDSVFTTYAQSLLANKGAFPQGTIVYLGNELNNLTLEYQGLTDTRAAGVRYAQQFKVFTAAIGSDSHYRIAPAPPDLYNGDWDPVPWMQAFRASGACAGADVLVANVFDGIPTRVAGISGLDAWRIVETDMCPGKKVVHFGGVGVNPNTQPPPSIQDQVEFLDTVKLPSGVETATALIIDPCKNSNVTKRDWLFYVYGKAYDSTGAEVLNDCSRNQSASFIYPGIDDQPTVAEKRAMAARYMYTCGSVMEFTGGLENEDKVDSNPASNYYSFIDGQCPNGNSGCRVSGITATVLINNQRTTLPLLRFESADTPRPTDPKRRLDDLEGFYNAPFSQAEGIQDIVGPFANGVVKKLSSREQQCETKLQFLRAIQSLCTMPRTSPTPINNSSLVELTDTGRCALDVEIPGTGKTYLQVLSEIPGTYSCAQQTPRLGKSVEEAFSKVEPTTHRGFKPAYIVQYVDTPDRTESGVPTTFDRFQKWFSPWAANGLTNTNAEQRLKSLIRITKVYVPAGFAELKNPSGGDPFPTYNGGFIQTMHSIFGKEEQKIISDEKKQEIETVINRSAQDSMKYPSDSGATIQCVDCMGPDADSLESIIVRRINAETFPTRIHPEYSQSCAGITDITGEKASERKQIINPGGTLDPVSEVQIRLQTVLTAKQSPRGSEARIRTYFLLPEEFRNLQAYENKMVDRFLPLEQQQNKFWVLTKAQEDRLRQKNQFVGFRYLQLSDNSFAIASPPTESGPIGIQYNSGPVAATAGPTSLPAATRSGELIRLRGKIVGPDTNQFDANPVTPGGKLARSLWEIICNIGRPNSNVPTAPYPGFESVLKEGPAACTKGMEEEAPGPTEGPIACRTTVIPSFITNTSTGNGLKQIIQTVASSEGVPPEILWGLLRIEGAGTITAVCNAPNSQPTSTIACTINSVGATGPMQILSKTCSSAAVVDVWANLGVSGNPCELEASLTGAARLLKQRYNLANIRDVEGIARWYVAAGAYHGLCLSTDQYSAGGCNETKRIQIDTSGNVAGQLCGGVVVGKSPAVQGCGSRNYCQCAQLMSSQFATITEASVCGQ